MKSWSVVLAGALFSVGLAVSGMTQTSKVQGFLSITNQWDPSLALVMVAAIAVYAPAYQLLKRRGGPLLASTSYLPTQRGIDVPLLLGAALFGIGWGLVGFCPGPALTSLSTLNSTTWLFVASMMVGMRSFGFVAQWSIQGIPRAFRRTERESQQG